MIVIRTTMQAGPAMERQEGFFRFLPLDECATSCDVYVTGAGKMVIRPGEKYPPTGPPTLYHFDWVRGRTLPEYQLVFVTEGRGEFESQPTGRVLCEAPTLIFLFPGVWHRYRPLPEVGWTERWFTFNGELIGRLYSMCSFSARQAVAKPRGAERLIRDCDDLLDRIQHPSTCDPRVLSFYLLQILTGAIGQQIEQKHELATAPRGNTPFVNDPIVQKALEIIWSQGQFPMSVEDIARQLPVTRRTLDRRFVEAMGHSVLEEMNACRLSRAKRLLAETDQPIKTVAHLAGFCSTERMRVLFVEREGKSPSEYRRMASQVRLTRAGQSSLGNS